MRKLLVAGVISIAWIGTAAAQDLTAGANSYKKCAACHTIERLAGLGHLVTNDMRKVKPRMETLGILWDREVADLRAYLNSVPPTRPRQ